MAYLVGTDEAGYGPNLGPLVVSASVWCVETWDELDQVDLFAYLHSGIRRPEEEFDEQHLRIGDSKQLYKPGQGLGGLEQGVLPVLAALQQTPRTWKQILRTLAPKDSDHLAKLPWYRDFDDELPVALSAKEVTVRAERLQATCEETPCAPTQIVSRVVCPPVFNDLCEHFGNKAAALSQTTLRLVRSVLEQLPEDEPVYILGDKHGGRNRYGPLLNEVFPDTLAVVRQEGRAESVYRLGSGAGRREIVFRAKADTVFLPSALASMVSKYLRELAMRAFNEYWSAHVADLKPTAGYPVDAKRFKKAIARKQQELGIEDHDLWRNR